jgi:hypothetical protein
VTGARGLLLAVLLCVAGAGAVLGSAGRTWVREETRVESPSRDRPDAFVSTTVERTGGDVAPAVRALGLVSLAGGAALVGARGRGRQAVGVVLAGAGAATSYAAWHVDGAHPTGAVSVAGIGGVVVAVSGLLTLIAGARWPALGSRYERPVTAPARDELADAWDALDRGDDLT